MAEFIWKPSGTCVVCGTGQTERGYVDAIGETNIRRDNQEIAGVADIIICATCCEQMARLVGSATGEETLDMAQSNFELSEELEKTRDEVGAWKQRYDNLVANLSDEARSIFEEKPKTKKKS